MHISKEGGPPPRILCKICMDLEGMGGGGRGAQSRKFPVFLGFSWFFGVYLVFLGFSWCSMIFRDSVYPHFARFFFFMPTFFTCNLLKVTQSSVVLSGKNLHILESPAEIVFSCPEQLYKSSCWSVCRSVGWSIRIPLWNSDL